MKCKNCSKDFEQRAHRLVCGDSRDAGVVETLMAGAKANIAITSPPYASQRAYDESSGFRPVPPKEYGSWYRAVAHNVSTVLAPDGSYFLNIKAHADEGERDLYVMDLVIAHKREWGWRLVDEFCWRKTDNGVPGGWPNRFKNAWEPVFHFCRQPEIKFRPQAAGSQSDDCFEYSADRRWYVDAGGMGNQTRNRENAKLVSGVARPSNVIDVKTEGGQEHAAPFPRALVEFFIKAFTDAGDVVFDPFMGSGTTMAAAQLLGRAGYGVEISPGYCDVILRRIQKLTGLCRSWRRPARRLKKWRGNAWRPKKRWLHDLQMLRERVHAGAGASGDVRGFVGRR